MAKSKKAVTAASISDVQVDVEEVKAPIVEAKAPVVREVIREVVREVPPAHASNLPSTAFLRNETITVKYIMKERSDIKDPKHVGYGGLFVGSSIAIPAPVDIIILGLSFKNNIIIMMIYLVEYWSGKIKLKEKQQLSWVSCKQIKDFNFLPGSQIVFDRIYENYYNASLLTDV